MEYLCPVCGEWHDGKQHPVIKVIKLHDDEHEK